MTPGGIRKVGRLCVGLACLLLVGCGLWRQSVPIGHGNPLAAELSALKADGGSAPLNTLADFGWAAAIGIVGDYLHAAGAGPFGSDAVARPWGNGAIRLVEGVQP